MTSGGGTAPLDMMHAVIARDHGRALALAVSEWFLQTHDPGRHGTAAHALRQRLSISHPAVLAAVGGDGAATSKLRSRAGRWPRRLACRCRQLERLFRRHLGESLGGHYGRLRLSRARDLLRQTSLPVTEVGFACGFASASAFSRAYRALYGRPPRGERAGEPAVPGRTI